MSKETNDGIDIFKLLREIKICEVCKIDHERKLLPRGAYNSRIDVMFIGHEPIINHKISRKGIVFGPYSKTGRMMNCILESIYTPKDKLAYTFWLTNYIKCSKGDGSKCYGKYLTREIELLKPRVVVLLGKKVTQEYMKQANFATKINWKMNGKCIPENGRIWIIYNHPSHLSIKKCKELGYIIRNAIQ